MMDRRIMAADLLKEETFVLIRGMIAQAVVVITVMTSQINVDDTKPTSDCGAICVNSLQF